MESFSFNPEKEKLNLTEKEAAELSLTKERTFEEYKELLRLTDEELTGKKILDLGSGQEENFVKETENRYQDTKVTSFDFSFKRPKREEFGQTPGSEQTKTKSKSNRVSGLFTKLPFKDGSFDIVVSAGAMPLYLNNRTQIEKAFKEVVRVLRRGGKAHLGPVAYTDIVDTDPTKTIWETHRKYSREDSEKLFKKVLQKLQKEIDFEFLPEETEQRTDRYSGMPETRVSKEAVLVITKK